ncbi:MAG: hypothetical protein ABSC49_02300 [Candidatus Microgenomates bacterium]|jgi:hypothetical protein
MNKDRVEVNFTLSSTLSSLGQMCTTVDRRELARNLQKIDKIAKARGLRPGEQPTINTENLRAGKLFLIEDFIGSADRVAVLYTAFNDHKALSYIKSKLEDYKKDH